MGTHFVEPSEFYDASQKGADGEPKILTKVVDEASGFAGVFPEHKYAIVQALKAMGHTVGMTGDGMAGWYHLTVGS